MQITYQKRDGCIIKRLRNTTVPYKIGETTSMGWKVLNIEYEYNDKYYSESEFNRLMHKNKQNTLKKKQSRELYLNELKKFIYYFLAVVIFNLLKLLLGI